MNSVVFSRVRSVCIVFIRNRSVSGILQKLRASSVGSMEAIIQRESEDIGSCGFEKPVKGVM